MKLGIPVYQFCIPIVDFKNVLPEVYEAIDNCDFMAIDTKFTGLSDKPESRSTTFETSEILYSKLKNCTSEFIVIQVGLCTFKYDDNKDKQVAVMK